MFGLNSLLMGQSCYKEDIKVKINKGIRISIIILAVILVSIISFVGVYVQNQNRMENVVPEYQLGMDLKGARKIVVSVSDEAEEIKYDANGSVIPDTDTTTEVAKTEEKPVNAEENKTAENYKKSRQIIEKRLKEMQVADYTVRENEENGSFTIQIPENDDTDMVVGNLITVGKFEILDDQTGEVLMTNADIASATAGYGSTGSGTTAIFVNIQFNTEGKEKLKNITQQYVESQVQTNTVSEDGQTNEEAQNTQTNTEAEDTTNTETQTKKIRLTIDGQTLLTTYFEEEITDGLIQLSVGSTSSSTTTSELQNYLLQAQAMATILNNGDMPLTYEMEQNKFVASDITSSMLQIVGYVALGILAILVLYMIIRYRKEGFFLAISFIGYVATLLLVIRYANVMITIDGMLAIALVVLVNFWFLVKLIKMGKEVEDAKIAFRKVVQPMAWTLTPLVVLAVVFTFAAWLPIFSFGMIIFWGILLSAVYHYILTRTLWIDIKK